jgi:aldose 1-epimerase
MSAGERSGRRAPSGHQYVITHGSQQAQVTQVGATLRTYTVEGRDVVDGFELDERATDGRGQVLAPWPNRLTDGRYRYGDRDCQAPINELGRNTAIHGLVRWVDWSLVAYEPTSVTLACTIRPQPGYEWQLDVQVTYALDPTGLTVTARAGNADWQRAPFGIGFHPYLTLDTESIDQLQMSLPTQKFVEPHEIGSTELDDALGELVRSDDGRAVARLRDPAGRSVDLWVDETFRYLMVYTGDGVGDPERRRKAVAIEPMTCPPDAFRSGIDVIELDPGQSWQGSWGMGLVG